ncbi:hypothetical protein THAOC_19806 [Thalassiosira oceanica]|uniref:Uncharacterized protein n=1 Tax=Thalassiosira oceanica TaxID=159749 RepID=K0S1G6_THAOC|nr:hypothetical protein THAOC_19806 [Thalassiosira oceanica]|eukprot:EJK59923.1 hypothetical protein THAOC_19806 [Thalassiosira oceanica]
MEEEGRTTPDWLDSAHRTTPETVLSTVRGWCGEHMNAHRDSKEEQSFLADVCLWHISHPQHKKVGAVEDKNEVSSTGLQCSRRLSAYTNFWIYWEFATAPLDHRVATHYYAYSLQQGERKGSSELNDLTNHLQCKYDINHFVD